MKTAKIFASVFCSFSVLLGGIGLYYSKRTTDEVNNTIKYAYYIDGKESVELPSNSGEYSFDSYHCTNDVTGSWNGNEWEFKANSNIPDNSICFIYFKSVNKTVIDMTSGKEETVKSEPTKEEEKQDEVKEVIEEPIEEIYETIDEPKVEDKEEEKKDTKTDTKEKNKLEEKKKSDEEIPDEEIEDEPTEIEEEERPPFELEEDEDFEEYKAYLKKATNIRDVDDLDEVVIKIPQFQVVTVLTPKDEKGRVLVRYADRVDVYTGVLYDTRIGKLPTKYVEIDISDQYLAIIQDDEPIMVVDVVTGKPSTPTPKGYYKINGKYTKLYLKGPTWNSYVDYFVPFIRKEYGIHDASWQSSFGGKRYLTNGSHGCVNISPKKMPELYKKLKVNMRVLIHD